MTRKGGVLLISAGLGLGAYAAVPGKTPLPAFDDRDFQVAALPAAPRAERTTVAKAPVLPPARPRTTITEAIEPTVGRTAEPAPRRATPAVVSLTRYNRLPLPAAQRPGAVPSDRAHLARDLQRELRRAGCYFGEITGAWTPSTRRAMKTLTERANASLPVDDPDIALLALARAQPDKICGLPCPPDEQPADGGRCVPAAVASVSRKGPAPVASRDAPAAAIGSWSTTAARTPGAPPLEGRMALAGPEDPDSDADSGLSGRIAPPPPTPPAYQPPAGPPPYAEQRRSTRTFDARNFFRRLDTQSAN